MSIPRTNAHSGASTRFPKFVIHSSTLVTNFGKQRVLAKYLLLVPLFDLKFLNARAATDAGTSNRRH
jgi:hypothetical protein